MSFKWDTNTTHPYTLCNWEGVESCHIIRVLTFRNVWPKREPHLITKLILYLLTRRKKSDFNTFHNHCFGLGMSQIDLNTLAVNQTAWITPFSCIMVLLLNNVCIPNGQIRYGWKTTPWDHQFFLLCSSKGKRKAALFKPLIKKGCKRKNNSYILSFIISHYRRTWRSYSLLCVLLDWSVPSL